MDLKSIVGALIRVCKMSLWSDPTYRSLFKALMTCRAEETKAFILRAIESCELDHYARMSPELPATPELPRLGESPVLLGKRKRNKNSPQRITQSP